MPQPVSGQLSLQHGVADPIGGLGGPALGAFRLALGAHAVDQRRPLGARRGQGCQQAGNIVRIVLAVAVHGGDDRAGGGQDAGAQGRALAAARTVPQIAQRGIASRLRSSP